MTLGIIVYLKQVQIYVEQAKYLPKARASGDLLIEAFMEKAVIKQPRQLISIGPLLSLSIKLSVFYKYRYFTNHGGEQVYVIEGVETIWVLLAQCQDANQVSLALERIKRFYFLLTKSIPFRL